MALNISWNAPTIKEIRVPDNTFGDKLSKGLSYIDSGLQRRRANRIEDENRVIAEAERKRRNAIEDEQLQNARADRLDAMMERMRKSEADAKFADMILGGDELTSKIKMIDDEINALSAENASLGQSTNTLGLDTPLIFKR